MRNEDQPDTIAKALAQAKDWLQEQGCLSARLDVQLLLAYQLGTDRSHLFTQPHQVLSEKERKSFWDLVLRRTRHEPIAYITGRKDFWSVSLTVDPRVLIPRPDTETILEEVADLYSGGDRQAPMFFIDVGTGSGCLICSLVKMFPQAQGLAIDIDKGALEVAKKNVIQLGLGSRIEVLKGDLLSGILDPRADLICANLPYIPKEDFSNLSLDIRLYEPLGALDGGRDGLDLIRRLIPQVPHRLRPRGWLVLEVGDGQAQEVIDLCKRYGLAQVHTRKDLSGIERVVAAQVGENSIH